MKLIKLLSFLLLFLTADIRLAQAMEGLPEKVAKQITSELGNSFIVKCYLKPCFFEGDFNSDGLPDYAVLLVKKGDMKRGIIFLPKGEKSVIVAAGNTIEGVAIDSERSDNFNWANGWRVVKKNEFKRDTDSDEIKGDVVILEERVEGGMGTMPIYWNGSSYARFLDLRH